MPRNHVCPIHGKFQTQCGCTTKQITAATKKALRRSDVALQPVDRPLALTSARRDKLCSKLHYDIMTARIQLQKIGGYTNEMDRLMFRLSVDAPTAVLQELDRTRRKRSIGGSERFSPARKDSEGKP